MIKINNNSLRNLHVIDLQVQIDEYGYGYLDKKNASDTQYTIIYSVATDTVDTKLQLLKNPYNMYYVYITKSNDEPYQGKFNIFALVS